ncbi:MAG: Xaa-Pro peptidase family protein [Pirellulales bacterium]|nr:Xaa-Pro peptidase family protein [Pirellulales bacterium]
MSHFVQRREKIRRLLRKERLDSLLVTSVKNVTYLSGFTGDDSYLLITPQRDLILSDTRYTTQLEEECSEIEPVIRRAGKTMLGSIAETLTKLKIKGLGFEANTMTVAIHAKLSATLSSAKLVATQLWVENLRQIKNREEIARTRLACNQARRAFEVARALITPNMTELDLAAELEYQARHFGGRCLSFPPIVGVGPRSALPHGTPTNRRIGSSDFTLIDWGVNEGLYVSDLTRILVTGRISAKLRKIYEIVLKAQLAAIEAIRPGATCGSIDRAARDVIAKAGFGRHFGHGLGHGIGLDVHEAPRMSQGQKTPLAAGMIVTVEPGIYLPGWGGIRIEDDILVTRSGHEILTSAVPKRLEQCVVE